MHLYALMFTVLIFKPIILKWKLQLSKIDIQSSINCTTFFVKSLQNQSFLIEKNKQTKICERDCSVNCSHWQNFEQKSPNFFCLSGSHDRNLYFYQRLDNRFATILWQRVVISVYVCTFVYVRRWVSIKGARWHCNHRQLSVFWAAATLTEPALFSDWPLSEQLDLWLAAREAWLKITMSGTHLLPPSLWLSLTL